MGTIKKMLGLLILPIISVGLYSCDKEQMAGTDTPELIYPSSIELQVPDEWKGYIYQDETGTDVLPLIAGQTVDLGYSLPEDASYKDVVWESSNKEIATVKDGLVTAIWGDGEKYSIVSVHPEMYFSGSIGLAGTLKVVVSEYVTPVTKVEVSLDERMEYFVNDIIQMDFSVQPENSTYKTVKWTSSDKSVAVVEETTGKVTFIGNGTVSITATSMDGKQSDSKEFKVKTGVAPTKVIFKDDMPKENLAYGEKINLRQYVTLEPEDASFSMVDFKDENGLLSVDANGILKVNFSSTSTVMIDQEVTLQAYDRNGNLIDGSVDLTLAGGHFIHYFADGFKNLNVIWRTDNGGTTWHQYDNYAFVDCSKSKRQDIGIYSNKNNPEFYINTQKYKYFAIKIRRPYWTDGEGNFARYQSGGKGNKLALNFAIAEKNIGHKDISYWLDMTFGSPALNKTLLWNGKPLVYVFDFSENTDLVSNSDENGFIPLTNFDIIIADMDYINVLNYEIYWLGTFESLEAIKEFYEANENE